MVMSRATKQLRGPSPVHAAAALGVVATAAAAAGGILARRRSSAARELALNAVAELAKVSSFRLDTGEEVCRIARELLGAAGVALFAPSSGYLVATKVSGDRLPMMRIPVDHPDAVTARAFRECETVFCATGPSLNQPVLRQFGARALLATPVIRNGDTIGVLLWIWRSRKRRVTQRERLLVEIIAAEKGIQLEREHLLEEAQRATREHVRVHLARDLHDSIAQELAVVRMYSQVALLERDQPDTLDEILRSIDAHAAKADEEMREVLKALRLDRPMIQIQISEIIRGLIAEFRERCPSVDVELNVDEGIDVVPRSGVRETVYFVLREALHNAAKYAGARKVTVDLKVNDQGGLTLRVADDGRGFDAGDVPRDRHGLVGMNERAELAGGQLEVASSAREGTIITLRIDDIRDHDTGLVDVFDSPRRD